MINKEIAAMCGTPLDASEGKLTRSDNEASGRPATVNLGMGEFSPRAGANPNGQYLVDGVSTGGTGAGPKRSSRRSAGAAPDSSM